MNRLKRYPAEVRERAVRSLRPNVCYRSCTRTCLRPKVFLTWHQELFSIRITGLPL